MQWTIDQLAAAWPRPSEQGDKYARGAVGIDTGSSRYPGAAILSTLGALYSGAGFIRFCGAEVAHAALLVLAPSVTFGPGRVNAWLLGSGWDDQVDNQQRFDRFVATGAPLVLDAGAIALLSQPVGQPCLLTPHAGELARLLGVKRQQIEEQPARWASQAAARYNVTVLLKGHRQCVVSPDGSLDWAMVGPSWTAQAGSGDCLGGISASLMAQGLSAHQAGLVAASVQAETARVHPGPYPPQQLLSFLPAMIAALTNEI
ncbi:MAG: NAD(P)H-hydrate dehydratase [Propionibacteriaceae bacterium]|nr:NAD(P)H-hydrate dehydratase [Propionibacteriaceae bacterium]